MNQRETMKLKRKILLFLCVMSFPFQMALSLDFGIPSEIPPNEVKSIQLIQTDFPPGAFYKGQNLLKDPLFAGWYKSSGGRGWSEIAQGVLESWSFEGTLFKTKYGFFNNSNEAQFGVQNVIPLLLGAEADPVSYQNPVSFDGQTLGDLTLSWEIGIERAKGYVNPSYSGDIVALAFSKGQYAFSIQAVNSASNVDKARLIELAKKVEKKIGVAVSLNSISKEMSTLISHQGVLHSLQVKLDDFSKHYLKGEYNTALNNMNSFVNELDAQRGKHVSEQAYPTLKALANMIISNTNSLLEG